MKVSINKKEPEVAKFPILCTSEITSSLYLECRNGVFIIISRGPRGIYYAGDTILAAQAPTDIKRLEPGDSVTLTQE